MKTRRRGGPWWWLLGTALLAWAGSWRVIYLEMTRWHHMSSPLRFTPPPAPAGAPAPHAGLPVIMAVVVAGVAPLLTVLAATMLLRARRT